MNTTNKRIRLRKQPTRLLEVAFFVIGILTAGLVESLSDSLIWLIPIAFGFAIDFCIAYILLAYTEVGDED
ncbi:MAG: hypothetical protein MR695_05890 [Solobacterium sp.]|nr:hypothetical protein [Solobacterium sp.]